MKKKSERITLIFISLSFLIFPFLTVEAKQKSRPFELKNGDRVVFLGNSLFENEQQYGFVELLLTSRWPDRNITFRNLGWSGDTVFGDARSYYTSPPSAYELMLDQLKKAKPTVVFIAYGAIEALEGEKGISRFSDGLNQLLDKIGELNAAAILLSPIPKLAAGTPEELINHNRDLENYATIIAKTAWERQAVFVDLYRPLKALGAGISDNGFHLNKMGYYHLATILETELGLPENKWSVEIDLDRNALDATTAAKLTQIDPKKKHLKFTVEEKYLPLPLDEEGAAAGLERILKIQGLGKGYFVLETDGRQVASASAKEWANGVNIRQGPLFEQARELQTWINRKDGVFFRQYRPQNRTYIVGFRSYEQGRHLKDLEDMDIILAWLDGQINSSKKPKASTYELKPIR